MKRDPLKAFVSLRDSLLKRKTSLETELAKINKALSVEPAAAAPVVRATAQKSAPKAKAAGRKVPGNKRAKNSMSLKQAVLDATKAKILSKPEILETIAKTGYKFTAKNPMNSLNMLLYSDKAFKNTGGKFGPA